MEKSSFFAYSWHIDDKQREQTVIRIYGLDEKNENVCVTVKDFTPYVYLELPSHIPWNDDLARNVTTKINYILGDKKPKISQLTMKRRLYYANMNGDEHVRFPYLFCAFTHHDDIDALRKKIYHPINVAKVGFVKLKMHEQKASPILQLNSVRKIPPAGWISFTGKRVSKDDKETHCKHEFVVSYKMLIEKVSTDVARPLIMGYDIEVNSSIVSRMPQSCVPEDKVFQISCIFARQGSPPETFERYLLTLGCPDRSYLEGITIKEYTTESDLLLGYAALMQEKQPNIITGYNIFEFDIRYMAERSKQLACMEFYRQGMNKYGDAREKLIKWSSSAYKNQEFIFLDAEGRLFVDLLPLVRRDHKLSNYKLKTVTKLFLDDMTKDPLDARGIFKCYRLGMKGGKKGARALGIVGKYCMKDSEITVRLFEVLTTWVGLCEMSKVCNTPIFSLFTQGQQLKVFGQVYRKCTTENIVVEQDGYVTKDDENYVGATVFPPVPGLYERVLPFDFSSLYPTTIIAYNICWSTMVKDDNISDEKCHVMKWEDHVGCCHDPKVIRIKELDELIRRKEAVIKDIRTERDLKCNKNRKDEFTVKIGEIKEKTKPLRKERESLKKSKVKNVMCAQRNFRWLKSPQGVLPEILANLLQSRAQVRAEMKKMKKELEGVGKDNLRYGFLCTHIEVLDKRQLALKISANSAYGTLGVKTGYLPLMPGAMCTTYMGRNAVQKAATEIQTKYKGKLVYGDTDSNYIVFPHLVTPQECWDYAVMVAKNVSDLFPRPMSLAFEETIDWKFFMVSKKRYMSIECNREGDPKRDKKTGDVEISKKGVLLQRRDNCDFIRHVYAEVTTMIFDYKEKEDVLYFVTTEMNKLCSHYYPTEKFVVTKSVGDTGNLQPKEGTNEKTKKQCIKVGDYIIRKKLPDSAEERKKVLEKDDCKRAEEFYLKQLPAQAQLAEKMRNRGQLVSAGSRIEYVVTTMGGHTAKQFVKIESLEYFNKHSDVLEIDYLDYLEKLVNPLDQLLSIRYNANEFTRSQYKLRLCKMKYIIELKRLFTRIVTK